MEYWNLLTQTAGDISEVWVAFSCYYSDHRPHESAYRPLPTEEMNSLSIIQHYIGFVYAQVVRVWFLVLGVMTLVFEDRMCGVFIFQIRAIAFVLKILTSH